VTTYDPDDGVRHISGPELDKDGLVGGEIALPGGLPPDDDEDEDGARFDVPGWEQAGTIADRDGFVLFDPEVPGGFRALTPVERAELTDAVRAGTPAATTSASDARQGTPVAGPRPEPVDFVDGEPVFDTEEGVAARERWAIENADPAKALDDTHPDDLDALQHRIDELRVRLSGYTWRDGVDRDQALAERREQLGRWHDDDTGADQPDSSDNAQGDDDGHAGRPQCLIYPNDPRWYE
jgi:hypothetical protein